MTPRVVAAISPGKTCRSTTAKARREQTNCYRAPLARAVGEASGEASGMTTIGRANRSAITGA